MTEEQFWIWLGDSYTKVDRAHAQRTLASILKPLPALEWISTWSNYADIHLLSNHRIEWVEHIIEPFSAYIQSNTVSSEYGCFKPDPAIYKQAFTRMKDSSPVIFVDDSEKNLRTAEDLGWETLLADEAGTWINNVLPLIST